MKRIHLISILFACFIGLNACSGLDDGVEFNFNDPQHIQWVEDIIDQDFLDALNDLSVQSGIVYIHFGHTPPNLDSISFIVDTLLYDTCIKFLPDGHISSNKPDQELASYKHHFSDQVGNIIREKIQFYDIAYQKSIEAKSDTTYIIGSGNDFTAYFKKKSISPEHGNPTYAYLVSGTLVYDTIPKPIGVVNYRIAKKIIATDPDPAPYYCKGTLMVLKPYHENDTIPFINWDTDTLTDGPSKAQRF